jgi:hypothetical protein
MVDIIEVLFPKLRGSAYRVTSAADDIYNCIAWAAGVSNAWWWPDGSSFWPADVPRQLTVAVFRQLFMARGYDECFGEEPEAGFEKIALFADALGQPTQSARQLLSGRWTSKLGQSEDIEHALRDLEGDVYGVVVLLMRRPVSSLTDRTAGP